MRQFASTCSSSDSLTAGRAAGGDSTLRRQDVDLATKRLMTVKRRGSKERAPDDGHSPSNDVEFEGSQNMRNGGGQGVDAAPSVQNTIFSRFGTSGNAEHLQV